MESDRTKRQGGYNDGWLEVSTGSLLYCCLSLQQCRAFIVAIVVGSEEMESLHWFARDAQAVAVLLVLNTQEVTCDSCGCDPDWETIVSTL